MQGGADVHRTAWNQSGPFVRPLGQGPVAARRPGRQDGELRQFRRRCEAWAAGAASQAAGKGRCRRADDQAAPHPDHRDHRRWAQARPLGPDGQGWRHRPVGRKAAARSADLDQPRRRRAVQDERTDVAGSRAAVAASGRRGAPERRQRCRRAQAGRGAEGRHRQAARPGWRLLRRRERLSEGAGRSERDRRPDPVGADGLRAVARRARVEDRAEGLRGGQGRRREEARGTRREEGRAGRSAGDLRQGSRDRQEGRQRRLEGARRPGHRLHQGPGRGGGARQDPWPAVRRRHQGADRRARRGQEEDRRGQGEVAPAWRPRRSACARPPPTSTTRAAS